jgi:hypothetical protein
MLHIQCSFTLFLFMGRVKTILTVRPCPLWAKQHADFGVVQK